MDLHISLKSRTFVHFLRAKRKTILDNNGLDAMDL